jgi:tetratricopeptide (TPR) repeat protein
VKKLLLTLGCMLTFALAHVAQAETPQSVQYYQYGLQLYKAKQYDQALRYFSASLKLDNRQATVYQAVGNCYFAKADKAHALQYYKYAYQLNPSNAALGQFIAGMGGSAAPAAADPLQAAHQLYRAQRYSEALQAYQAVAAQQPGNAKVYQSIGNSYYAMQDKPNALAAYQKSLQLDPSNAALAAFVAKMGGGTALASSGGDGDWFQPMWRSAILPGWGQAYNGEKGKGYVLGAVTLGLLAGEVATFVVGDAARQQYLGLTDPKADYDTPYATWESMANLNHIFFWSMTAAYAYTVVDAMMGSHKTHLAAADPPALNVALTPGGVQASLRVLEF